MAMHLIDRPHFQHERSGYRGLSAMASATLHAAVVLTLVAVMRMSPDERLQVLVTAAVPPQNIKWFPDAAVGGGRDRGGQHAIDPPRRQRAIGTDAISVTTSAVQPSTDSTIDPPEDVSTLPAEPIGDATQALPGTIESRGTSAGPGDTGVGDSKGPNNTGRGNQPTDGSGPGIRGNGPGVTMPTLVERVAPKYTVEAMQARIQGSVWIECVVLPDGSVGNARAMRSLDRRFGLDEEAIAAAKRWRFRPGLLNGKPVPVVISIELMFSMR